MPLAYLLVLHSESEVKVAFVVLGRQHDSIESFLSHAAHSVYNLPVVGEDLLEHPLHEGGGQHAVPVAAGHRQSERGHYRQCEARISGRACMQQTGRGAQSMQDVGWPLGIKATGWCLGAAGSEAHWLGALLQLRPV